MIPNLELNLELEEVHKRGYSVLQMFTPFWSYTNSLKITVLTENMKRWLC